MREIVVIERSTVTQDGKTAYSERKYRGILAKDGSFRLQGCCGKNFASPPSQADKQINRRAA